MITGDQLQSSGTQSERCRAKIGFERKIEVAPKPAYSKSIEALA